MLSSLLLMQLMKMTMKDDASSLLVVSCILAAVGYAGKPCKYSLLCLTDVSAFSYSVQFHSAIAARLLVFITIYDPRGNTVIIATSSSVIELQCIWCIEDTDIFRISEEGRCAVSVEATPRYHMSP